MALRIVAATRLAEDDFFRKTLLGQSIRGVRASHPQLELNITFNNRCGLPEIYNTALASAKDSDIVVFVHDDVRFDDWLLESRLKDALAQFDVVGVAGNKRRVAGQIGWAFLDEYEKWDDRSNLSGAISHEFDGERHFNYFGQAPAAVQFLDGVFLAARAYVLNDINLRFDPRFAFHFYDVDFCRACEVAGLRMGTWPIALTHGSPGGFDSVGWREAMAEYREKWGEVGA